MAFTDNFRKQHQEILAIAAEISAKLKADQARTDPQAVRALLSNLSGKVSIHLAMEDKALYPRLADSRDEDAKAVAGKYMLEMGGLAQVFTTYSKKWQTSQIATDPAGFADETRTVLTALGQRIEREDTVLYPLADKAAL